MKGYFSFTSKEIIGRIQCRNIYCGEAD